MIRMKSDETVKLIFESGLNGGVSAKGGVERGAHSTDNGCLADGERESAWHVHIDKVDGAWRCGNDETECLVETKRCGKKGSHPTLNKLGECVGI